MGKLDAQRTRYEFSCHFNDAAKGSAGVVKGLLIVNNRNESYFESLSIFLEEPKHEVLRIVETEMTYDEILYENAKQHNLPKLPRTKESGP